LPQPTTARRCGVEITFPVSRQPLHKYLDDRYADAVALTFAEIEDLAGFALPDLARLSNDWWTAPGPGTTRSRFADSWIQANRIARPNLGAQTVAFLRAC
jgi:hypothetical protein